MSRNTAGVSGIAGAEAELFEEAGFESESASGSGGGLRAPARDAGSL